MHRRRVLGAAVAVGGLAIGPALTACAPGAGASPGDGRAVVVAIVDGDTIDVDIAGRRERIRLIGIDTPEVAHGDGSAECFGPEASAFTARLVPVGSVVELERDVVGRDDYGRLLAYVYLPADGDPSRRRLLVNTEIARAGFAQPMSIPPNTAFANAIAGAARQAELADRGLWQACAS